MDSCSSLFCQILEAIVAHQSKSLPHLHSTLETSYMVEHLKAPILLPIHSAKPVFGPAAGERGPVSGSSLLSANVTQLRASPNVWNQTLPVGCSRSFPQLAQTDWKLVDTHPLSRYRHFFVYSSPLSPLQSWYPTGLTTINIFFLLGSEKK